MKRFNYLVLIVSLAFLLPSVTVFSQEPETPALNKGSLEYQFRELLDKSSTYQDSKVVKVSALNAFNKHVADSLTKLKKQITEAKNLGISNQQALDSVKNHLNNTNTQLVNVQKSKDSIPFLFLEVNKDVYNKVVWGLIGGLTLALLVFIVLYKKTKGVINQAKADLEEKKAEFESFRKRALERESQISRNYLNELNKYRSKSQLEFNNN